MLLFDIGLAIVCVYLAYQVSQLRRFLAVGFTLLERRLEKVEKTISTYGDE